MAKPILTCTTPYGTFTRGSYRPYTHVLVSVPPASTGGKGVAVSWHSSRPLAEQAKASYSTLIANHQPGTAPWLVIVPVDGGSK